MKMSILINLDISYICPREINIFQIQDEPNYFLLKFDIKTKGHHSI